MGIAHGCLFLWRPLRLQVIFHRFNHLLYRTALESLLLRPAPRIGFLTLSSLSRRGQILTDMKKIAQKGSLLPKHLTTLQPDPFRPVPNGVNLAIQSPARFPRAVSQATPHCLHVTEGGPVEGPGAVLGLRRHQPHFLPVPGTFALSLPWLHGSNQRSIGLSNHMFGPHLGQKAVGLRV